MNLIFMGTPEFALPSIRGLLGSSNSVRLVVTQPDRPSGRGQRMTAPPVKILAEANQIPVLQPSKMKDAAFHQALRAASADAIVVVAFGRILPKAILEIPPRGCINVHASLLPKYRGAAPIHWALIRGETETGVTIMQMDEGMDTGPVYRQETTPISPDETSETLSDRLAQMGAALLLRTLAEIESGAIRPSPQDSSRATLAPPIEKEAGRIDWSRPAVEIDRLVRALEPRPGAFTAYQGERWRIVKLAVVAAPPGTPPPPGTILEAEKEQLRVAAGGGSAVDILGIQADSGRRMTAAEFLAGHRVKPGVLLGA